MAFSSSSKSIVQSAAEEVLVAPVAGGCMGTYTTLPPGISMLEMYWSKKGSKTMTSSPSSIKAIKALSIPRIFRDVH
jgi:hypothetical protein